MPELEAVEPTPELDPAERRAAPIGGKRRPRSGATTEDASRPAARALPLLEREDELGQLDRLLDDAAQGRGRLALIAGPAGMGKSRLLGVARQAAADRRFKVLAARAGDLERGYPYGIVRQLLGPAVDDGSAVLDGAAAYARPVFEPPAPPGDAAHGAPEQSEVVLHGLNRLVLTLCGEGPLLLCVDDAHWADNPSLVFLNYLSRRIEPARLAVLIAIRATEPGPEAELARRLLVDPSTLALSLRPLSEDGTAQLVRAVLGETAPDELCRACHATTGGNPFLVRELTGALAADVVPPDQATRRVRRLVPEAVAGQVLVRMSRIGPAAGTLAHALALLGAGADLHQAAALAELDEGEAADALDALVAADIVGPGPPIEFVHPLLAEAVYHDIRPGQRALLHARAARLLSESGQPVERVAAQLLVCDPAGSEWVVDTLRHAAREAMSRGAPQAAAGYLARARTEPPPPRAERDLLLELGVAESRAASPSAPETLSSALRLTDDPVAQASIAQELAAYFNLRGKFSEAAATLDETIRALPREDTELRLSLEAEAAVMAITALEARHQLSGRMAALCARLGELIRTPSAEPLLAILALELSESDGSAADAARCARRAFADGRLRSRPGPIVSIGTAALISTGRTLEAEAILDAAIDEAQSRGATLELANPLATRARARNQLGRTSQAEADARQALELSPPESNAVRPLKVAQLADALIVRGALREAERLLSATELARDDRDTILFQSLRPVHARLLDLRGQRQEALDELAAVGRWARAWGCANPGWIAWRPPAALVHRALGHHEEARLLAAEELKAAHSFGAPHCLGVALRVVGLVSDPPEIESLRESGKVLKSTNARPELARSLVELGSALRRAGHPRDSQDPLQRAYALATDCGHALLADHTRRELLASGGRPPPAQPTGPAPRTARGAQ